jgi:hypothetical protein
MATEDQERLEVLYQDILEDGLPAPDLLAQYATAPNELSEEERLEVESAAGRFPAVADELDTLRGFDFAALDADLQENASASVASTFRKLFMRPAFVVGLAASAGLAAWLSLGQGPSVGDVQPTPDLASTTPEAPNPKAALEPVPTSIIPEVVELAQDQTNSDESAPGQSESTSIEGLALELASESAPPFIQEAVDDPDGDDGLAAAEAESAPERPEILLAMLTPTYQMPFNSPLRQRDIGGFRAAPQGAPLITLLAPAHLARTTSKNPRLFWHIDRVPDVGAFYLTISTVHGEESIVENLALAPPTKSGIQGIDLATLEVKVGKNEEYRWSIAHRLNPEAAPSTFAFGWIVGVEPDAQTRARLDSAPSGEKPDVLARDGYWYDALQATVELVEQYPLDHRTQAALDALLEQGGIQGIGD